MSDTSSASFPPRARLRVKIFDPNAGGEPRTLDIETETRTKSIDALKKEIALQTCGDGNSAQAAAAAFASLRLIYSGKLLEGSALLSQVLRMPKRNAGDGGNDDDDEDLDQIPSFAMHAVLPLNKSTKDKYSHEVRA